MVMSTSRGCVLLLISICAERVASFISQPGTEHERLSTGAALQHAGGEAVIVGAYGSFGEGDTNRKNKIRREPKAGAQSLTASATYAGMSLESSINLKFDSNAPTPDLVIVVPFHHGELRDCERTLQLWNTVSPCHEESVADILFVSSIHKDDLNTPRAWAEKPELHGLFKCFRKITYGLSSLTPAEDKWPSAPDHVFFWMMLESGLRQQYKWIQQMELDVYPIKENWLSKELTTIRQAVSTGRPWMIGAACHEERMIGTVPALNGNAIYIADPEFITYLQGYRSRLPAGAGYDSELPKDLVSMLGQESTGRLVDTPFMLNCGMLPLHECFHSHSSADAYLMHSHFEFTSSDLKVWQSGSR